ncbi:MAG: c-type cytochrome [Gemmatimonadetes bacterium]|nr:c-type cytochrome [Gemmatimonadota bacterium]
MRSAKIALSALLCAALVAACDSGSEPVAVAAWAPPAESEIPADSFGASVRRGLALLRFTPESLPAYATSSLRCTSCHQFDGRKESAPPLITAHARYPRYLDRTGAVVSIQDRVNYCFTRSLAGNALPGNSREMSDIIAYLAFLSRGAPVGGLPSVPTGMAPMAEMLVGDTTRGRELFTATCVTCHGVDGAGAILGVPALWGAQSYSIGASMARHERGAAFIFRNMPQDKPGSLTAQDAFDLSAYVNSHERPDSPGKEFDFPGGDAPADVPYATRGHTPPRPTPRLLPRANPDGATVPAPPSVRRGAP